ncbi:MAG: prepilin-type N-terminal cleavage/methylation domain-containing protein [Nitrospinae bacterium]|nr:prepilin-type N-terminal cleavage/methylation domain-containing protein [Nitrospinota bacterium]
MRRRGGFTLIEIMVVMVIIAVMAGLLVPRLPDVGASRLKYGARKIAGTISYMYDRAAATGMVYRLTMDMEKNEFNVWLLNKENVFEETRLPFAKKTKLSGQLHIAGVQTAGEGKAVKGEAAIHFYPGGFTEEAAIYLTDEAGREMTLTVAPLTGRVKILEGYHALKIFTARPV